MRARRRFLCGLAALLAGCAGFHRDPAPPTREWLDAQGAIGVVAVDRLPEVHLEGFSASRLAGFTQGAGDTFVSCLQLFGHGACVNSACGAYVLVLLGSCGTAGVVGGLVGALTTDADRHRQSAARGIDRALLAAPAQSRLRDALIDVARQRGIPLAAVGPAGDTAGDYRALAEAGIGSVIEVELLRVGTEGPGGGAPSRLYMDAQARLVRVGDNGELARRRFVATGQAYSVWEWEANGGERLIAGFQATYERLAEQIGEAFLFSRAR